MLRTDEARLLAKRSAGSRNASVGVAQKAISRGKQEAWEVPGKIRVVTRSHLPGSSAARQRGRRYPLVPQRTVRLLTALLAVLLIPPALRGCNRVQGAKAPPPSPALHVAVTSATLVPAKLEPGSQTHLTLHVHNTGANAVPNVVVSLAGLGAQTDPENNPGNKPLPTTADIPGPNWLVDSGPGGAPLEGSNTWLGGPLAAGASVTMKWQLTAVRLGSRPVGYVVSGGLTAPPAHATSGAGLSGKLPAL